MSDLADKRHTRSARFIDHECSLAEVDSLIMRLFSSDTRSSFPQ